MHTYTHTTQLSVPIDRVRYPSVDWCARDIAKPSPRTRLFERVPVYSGRYRHKAVQVGEPDAHFHVAGG